MTVDDMRAVQKVMNSIDSLCKRVRELVVENVELKRKIVDLEEELNACTKT